MLNVLKYNYKLVRGVRLKEKGIEDIEWETKENNGETG